MKTSTIPIICGVALAGMSTAGLSHWWSVRQFAAVIDSGIPISSPVAPRPAAIPATAPAAKPVAPDILAANKNLHMDSPANSSSQREFFEAMLKEIKTLRTENLNLVDQMAETNRDLMKLEFRVDTHSESFRPLPTSEERPDTSFDTTFDDGPGVLPPRAEPVFPSSNE